MSAAEMVGHNCMVATSVVIPDVAGEIIGWRAWNVVGEHDIRLGSVTHTSYIWHPGTKYVIAECSLHSTEEIPDEKHPCGFYAAKTREHLLSMSYHRYTDTDNVVIGEVALSGKVIPGTQGWRAQKARIVKVYVPFEKWRLLEKIKEVYGVEVQLANTLLDKSKPESKGR
jgi:hypothetical protein